jgi:cholest-4-en-3-one 26-monooxygenase
MTEAAAAATAPSAPGKSYQMETNVFNPATYLAGVPHEAWTKLRAECPVYFQDEPHGGYWAITRHDDIVRCSKDPATFSSYRGGSNIEDYAQEDLSNIRMLMVNMDPPQHRKFRNLVRTGFTPRMVRATEPKVRERVNEILDRAIKLAAEQGTIDFVREIAAELPLQVIADLIGVPQEDRGKLFDWSNRLIGFDDPEFQTSIEDARMAAMEVWMYANALAESRQGETGDDLVRVLMNAEIDGEKLNEMEFDSFFLLLAVAGNETTRNAISGGMLALLENPAEYERLREKPEIMDTGADEVVRWVTPVMYFRRTATRDVEIRGQLIKENEKICMIYPSANRDEAVFSDPFRFDLTRSPNDHLAFGVGEHFCLGASLARMEIRVMFEEIAKRIAKIELAGDVRRLQSNFINGFKEIPVKLTPA